jgi:hypothetical protein
MKKKKPTRMKRAIEALGKAAAGRKWVLIWQSTHPDVQPAKLRVAYQHASETEVNEMFQMALTAKREQDED